ncbi:MAG: hypothetical protein ABIO40_06340 [Devosia sp.]
MLAVTSYNGDYLAARRAEVAAQLKAYRKLLKAAPDEAKAFAPGHFASLVLALDSYFLHRQRSLEGKEGGALNELRMLCDGIKDNYGVMGQNATIKYDAGKSVTGIAAGEKILLDDKLFERLAEATFADVGKRYR